MYRQLETKVTPAVLEAITSIEISEKLSAILDLLQRQVPEGKLYTIPVASVNIIGTMVVILFGATLYNYGSASVYILDSDRNINTASDEPLESGQNLAVDFRTRGQYPVWLKTLSGTARVGIHAYK